MALESMKKEIVKEMEAVCRFIELAIASQKQGYFKAAEFFLGEAMEDCRHAFTYAKELDKHQELSVPENIQDIAKAYYDLEFGAIGRLNHMLEEIKNEGKNSSMHFVLSYLEKHSNEAYKARKLMDKINILAPQEAINDIEELFEELASEE